VPRQPTSGTRKAPLAAPSRSPIVVMADTSPVSEARRWGGRNSWIMPICTKNPPVPKPMITRITAMNCQDRSGVKASRKLARPVIATEATKTGLRPIRSAMAPQNAPPAIAPTPDASRMMPKRP
jgi:hypothetical protein